MQTIIGQYSLICVENVAGMLCSLLAGKDGTNVDWRVTAEGEIAHAKTEVAKNGGSMASAEEIFLLIFYRALDQKVKLA